MAYTAVGTSITDDAATSNWGGDWHMPTVAQFNELANQSYTKVELTTMNGIKGYKITSISNGQSIFLPSADILNDGTRYNNNTDEYWDYWSCELCEVASDGAHMLHLTSRGAWAGGVYNYRYIGLPVRPVIDR